MYSQSWAVGYKARQNTMQHNLIVEKTELFGNFYSVIN